MATTTLSPGVYGNQPITSNETLISQSGPSSTAIMNSGGFYTQAINFDATVSGAQVGDLSGHGFTIMATNPGGVAVQMLGSNDALDGNVLIANDPTTNGSGADLITGSASTATPSPAPAMARSISAISPQPPPRTLTLSPGGPTTYEPGTITVANNNFSHWNGTDIITFDANYTFAKGNEYHSLTATVAANGTETDTLSGVLPGDHISLNHGVTVTAINQVGTGMVNVKLSDGDHLVLEGNGLNSSETATILGIQTHHDAHIIG